MTRRGDYNYRSCRAISTGEVADRNYHGAEVRTIEDRDEFERMIHRKRIYYNGMRLKGPINLACLCGRRAWVKHKQGRFVFVVDDDSTTYTLDEDMRYVLRTTPLKYIGSSWKLYAELFPDGADGELT